MKFFVPYGCNRDPEVYFQYINLLKDYIEGIYFADINVCNIDTFRENENFKNLSRLLELLSETKIEKFYVLNPPKPGIKKNDKNLVEDVINRYGKLLTGFTVSNMYLAEYINSLDASYKIDISSNTLLHNPMQLLYWKRNCNLFSVNVPRMSARNLSKLKEFKEVTKKLSIKTKLIVNESCVYGCPFEINCDNFEGQSFCRSHFDPTFIVRSNWVSPSYLKTLDEYVDIGKIVYRGLPEDIIFNILIHYINGDDDIGFFDLIKQPRDWGDKLKKRFFVPISKFPKKIFSCGCKECKSFGLGDCEICEKFMEHYLK